MNNKDIDFNKIKYKRTEKYVIFERFEFSKLIHNVADLKFQNKELKEDNSLYKKFLVGAGILIIILLWCLLSMSYEKNVQRCINAGHNENYCREELAK